MDVRLRSFLMEKTSQEVDSKAGVQWQKPDEANKGHARALDNALLGGLGMGLQTFVAARPPAAFTANQQRAFVPSSKLPKEIAAEHGHETRAVIIDRTTKEKHLEVAWGPERRSLWEAIDCGSIGYWSKFLLY